MVTLWNRADHYIFILSFVLSSSSSSFFFSSSNLSRRRSDVCHTSTHGVALVRISDAGLKPPARRLLKTQDAKSRQKSPSGHHCTSLSGYIFATKARIDNRKKILSSNVLHMSPPYGELRPTSGWDRSSSLRYPCKFQRVSRLGSVTARHLVVGISQTLRRWTQCATNVWQGDHHVGHWPTF